MEILEEKKTNGSTLMGIQNIKLCSIPNKVIGIFQIICIGTADTKSSYKEVR